MKKSVTCIFAILICCSPLRVRSQDNQDQLLRTKKGVPVLPKAGDWALGIDATPFFRYFGNLVNNAGNPYIPSFGFTAQNPGTIYGKYKISESTTLRGNLLLGITNDVTKSQNGTNPDQVDKTIVSAIDIGLIGGIERSRKVFGRLAGYYGVQAGILKEPFNAGTFIGKRSFKDANDSDNNFHISGGNTYSILGGGFAGVEFFIAPRIALAGEFNYNLRLYTQTERKNIDAAGTENILDYGGRGVELAPAQSGNLQLLLYF